ncbi:S8 family serine peptidase [Halostella sp. JP-L12]|uniref:S8 family peptidase n=1 Tax=Halostella TaxID=1843185 RepID=UPI000EF77CCA|nr:MULTISPECIES: S8 family serine peptidase [Halostella]NHN48672.1 S8 family serine peptidase [Halostella sp. JP-L12]
MTIQRRDFIKGIAASGLSLAFTGLVGAQDDATFLVVADGDVRRGIEDAGFAVRQELADGSVYVVVGSEDDRDDLDAVEGVSEVARDVRFEFEGPERVEQADTTTDEDRYPLQWDKQVTDVAEAHETTAGEGTRLAIIDTGIDFDHPDLKDNVNAEVSRLFRYGEVTSDAEDVHGHGTHVAGIAAASDEGTTGIVGTAPDAELVSLRVFYYDDVDGDGDQELTTTTADILTAIDHAASLDADAANLSIGTPPLPPETNATGIKVAYQRVAQDAVRRGTLVVVSAGNSDANLQQGGYFTVPNSVAGAMSVSATGPNDERVFYSNYGTNEIDVGAPGGGYETLEKTLADDTEWPFPTNLVLSSVPPELYDGDYYAYFAGTSMAAPQVTGLAGLIRAADSGLNANQVEQAIKDGAELVDGQSDPDLGAGRINAANSLDEL